MGTVGPSSRLDPSEIDEIKDLELNGGMDAVWGEEGNSMNMFTGNTAARPAAESPTCVSACQYPGMTCNVH